MFRLPIIITIGMILPVSLFVLPVPATPAETAAKTVTDNQVTWAVEAELLRDEAVDANFIDVTTQEGVVSLTGTIPDIRGKERAERVAEHVVGVRAVVNRIQVEPPMSLSDAKLAKNVRDALLYDPATDSYEVSAEARNGVVTLTGTVESWQEKQLCETVTKGVPGVAAVKNDIDIVYRENRPDEEIREEIEARLANDVLVDDKLITVKVTDGTVSLSGSAGSLTEKHRAMADGWVTGTKAVDGEALDVVWWARDTMRRTDLYEGRSDEAVAQAVKDALLYDPRVMPFSVDVHASAGTVVLSGEVDNLRAMRSAKADAANVTGVWRVKNHLKVRPNTIPSSDVLERNVTAALLTDPVMERMDLSVDAYGSTVFLEGEVNTPFERTRAERLAESVRGVVRVVNGIEARDHWLRKPDWEIQQDTRDELFWSPFVDEDDITVTVNHGVVTLSGTVDTWSQRKAAEDNALEAGAKEVVNDLTVTFPSYGPHIFPLPAVASS